MEKKIALLLIVMLKARREQARHYIFNNNMLQECYLLDAEIKALESYLDPDQYAGVGSTNNVFP